MKEHRDTAPKKHVMLQLPKAMYSLVAKRAGSKFNKATRQTTYELKNKDPRSKKCSCGEKAVFSPHTLR
jgi:hypothetical protein